MNRPFEHRFQVALHDTDAAGVLFFAHLFRHAHDAYEAWMAALGHPLERIIRERAIALPLVHAEADYRQPLRHGNQVRVTLGVAALGEKRFEVRYRFERSPDDLAATARTVHACIDASDGRSRLLPADLRAALSDHLLPG